MDNDKLKDALDVLFHEVINLWEEIGELSISLNKLRAQISKDNYNLYKELYNLTNYEDAQSKLNGKEINHDVLIQTLIEKNGQTADSIVQKTKDIADYAISLRDST